ncbi:hypothetical protein K7I13_15300 [Brucepastera parasyntrophica]|uniref:hypothetical protein n=1 Tax=Brucepastera parasyntrophica TaxID=2880008 RepID=UPI00210E5E01|nr:hypothetical protein [Brucepastera parasyntrophica]ULQ59788.1 hypothetical protein K7I13_15300 [Brucepastera parasyntrophica]
MNVQLLRVQEESGNFTERLSVFAFFDDPDGNADFGEMELTHSDTGLFWVITPDESFVRLRGQNRWTGVNNLAGPAGKQFPSGNYSLKISDLAGNEDIYVFELVRPVFPESAPVAFSMSGGEWELNMNPDAGDFVHTFFLLYNSGEELVYSWRVPGTGQPQTRGTISALKTLGRDITFLQCYTENAAETAGVLLTPVRLE